METTTGSAALAAASSTAAPAAASAAPASGAPAAPFIPYNLAAQPYAGLPTPYLEYVDPAPFQIVPKPRRPRSAYLFFASQHRKKLQAAFPDLVYLTPAETPEAVTDAPPAAAPAAAASSSTPSAAAALSTPATLPNPTLQFSSLSQLLGSAWRSLPASKRAHYDRLSEEDKARYHREMAERDPKHAREVKHAMEAKARRHAATKRNAEAKERKQAKRIALELGVMDEAEELKQALEESQREAAAENGPAAAEASAASAAASSGVEPMQLENPFTVAPATT